MAKAGRSLCQTSYECRKQRVKDSLDGSVENCQPKRGRVPFVPAPIAGRPERIRSKVAGLATVRAMKTDRSTQGMMPGPLGDEELSREDWIDRFALRLAMLDDMQHPLELLLQMGNDLWPSYGGVEPEVIAEAEYRSGLRR